MASIRLNPLHSPTQAPIEKPIGITPVHMATRVNSGGLHSYLGHFAQPKFLMAGHNTSGHWIQGAIKHPGAEKRAAKKAGMSTHAYMEKNKGKGGKAGARARLGLRLEGMNRG